MIRIADFHLQAQRLFGRFLDIVDTPYSQMSGKYDIIFVHREIEIKGEIEKVIQYCKPSTKIIVDITTESGQVELFLERFKKILEKYDYNFILITDLPIKEKLNCKVIDDYSLAFFAHLNDSQAGRVYYHNNGKNLIHGIQSFNGSLRMQRLWLNYFITIYFKHKEIPTNIQFWHYVNKNGTIKFDEETFNDHINTLPINVKEKLLDKQYVNPPSEPNLVEFNDLIENTHTINIVSENVIGKDIDNDDDLNHITFTEKTIKPFVRGQIPLIHGYMGLQDELINLGFDLYDDFVDHSYTNESDSIKRLEMIVKESIRLSEMNTLEYLKKNYDRVYKNKKLCETLMYKGKQHIMDLIENFVFEN